MIALPPGSYGPVDENIEYNAFRLAIDHAGTLGTGSCAGCSQSACVAVSSFRLFHPTEVEPVPIELMNAAIPMIMWQGTIPECPGYIPTRNRTWGSVKTLYR
ncbi:MAG: hypothetical protein IT348_03475 [Candidatus Eisenbacteria bacterium]|nr:hypothetical protein [Candidatus Eisenbacteria bacterium]